MTLVDTCRHFFTSASTFYVGRASCVESERLRLVLAEELDGGDVVDEGDDVVEGYTSNEARAFETCS